MPVKRQAADAGECAPLAAVVRDRPAPGRFLARREVVVVPARQRLQRDQRRVVLEVQPDARGRGDLAGARRANDSLPAKPRAVEPVGDPDRAAGRAPIHHRGELGDPAARRGEARVRRRARRSSPGGSSGSRPAARRRRPPARAPGSGPPSPAGSRRRGPADCGRRAPGSAGRRRSGARASRRARGRPAAAARPPGPRSRSTISRPIIPARARYSTEAAPRRPAVGMSGTGARSPVRRAACRAGRAESPAKE